MLLIDNDVPFEPYRSFFNVHDRAFIYPHGGGPLFGCDEWEVDQRTRGQFVIGEGQKQLLEHLGYPRPVKVVGWPWTPLRPFRPATPERVLFAPMHPDGEGNMSDEWLAVNRDTFDQLVRLGVRLTVRTVGTPKQSGIPCKEGVFYTQSPGMVGEFRADVVVTAVGTFPSLAVAQGYPTVVVGQHIRPCDFDPETREERPAVTWERWRHLGWYPFDSVDRLEDACTKEASEWRDRFIGSPMTGFAKVFEEAVNEW